MRENVCGVCMGVVVCVCGGGSGPVGSQGHVTCKAAADRMLVSVCELQLLIETRVVCFSLTFLQGPWSLLLPFFLLELGL